MSEQKDLLERSFTRRALFLAGVQSVLGLSLIGRLYYLSGRHGEDYKSLAEKNRVKVNFKAPGRGEIYDRSGKVLAKNKQTYRLMVLGEQIESLASALQKAQEFVTLEEEEIELLRDSLRFRPKFLPTLVRDNLSWEEACGIETKLFTAPGFFIDRGWSRFYPAQDAFSHLIGYVRSPSEAERLQNKVYRLTDVHIGKSGVEKYFNPSLEGEAGFERLEVNARGRTVKTLQKQDAVYGKNLTLSVDESLQSYAAKRLASQNSGSVVVMDIKTGEVLALVSHPSFDANLFTRPVATDVWNSLNNNPYGVMHNKPVHGLYPPGSLFKMVVALAALEEGIVAKNFHANCKGYVEIGSHRFHCWHKWGGHGSVGFERALSESCDVFFYELAPKLGADRIAKMAHKLGLGSETGIEILGERAGLIPTPQWQQQTRGIKWRPGDTLNMGIGQGAMLATPLQLCVMMARLAGTGKMVQPTLLKDPVVELKSADVNEAHLKIIQEGLSRTVNHPSGLAFKNRIKEHAFAMAGKTATCQVRRVTMAERKRGVLRNDQRPWAHRDHALFAGYAPAHDPRYALSVVVEHGGGGGSVAAPIGRDILYFAQTGREFRVGAAEKESVPEKVFDHGQNSDSASSSAAFVETQEVADTLSDTLETDDMIEDDAEFTSNLDEET